MVWPKSLRDRALDKALAGRALRTSVLLSTGVMDPHADTSCRLRIPTVLGDRNSSPPCRLRSPLPSSFCLWSPWLGDLLFIPNVKEWSGKNNLTMKRSPFDQAVLDEIFKFDADHDQRLASRESGRLEFKEAVNFGSTDEYAKDHGSVRKHRWWVLGVRRQGQAKNPNRIED